MHRKRTIFALAATIASIVAPAFSQDDGPAYRNEVVGQAFGSFVKTTTDQGIRQSATDSGGVLGTYRYFFTRRHGVEGNYGYSQNTQRYGLTSSTVGVKARSHEVSGAYVFRFPTRVVTPFALGGAGALIFDPKDAPSLDTQSRFTFVYGGGADFNVSSRLYVRAEFRGLIYKTPTWDIPSLANMDRWSHRAEPSAGIGFRF
jgi:opacity protein-like surface antigen